MNLGKILRIAAWPKDCSKLLSANDGIALGKRLGIAQSKMIEYQGSSHGIVLTERDRVTRDLQAFILA